MFAESSMLKCIKSGLFVMEVVLDDGGKQIEN